MCGDGSPPVGVQAQDIVAPSPAIVPVSMGDEPRIIDPCCIRLLNLYQNIEKQNVVDLCIEICRFKGVELPIQCTMPLIDAKVVLSPKVL